MISALTLTEGKPRLMVAHEDLLGSAEVEVSRISRFRYDRDAGNEITSRVLQESLRRDLQHHPVSLEEKLNERSLPFGARMLCAGLVLASVQHRDSFTGRHSEGPDPCFRGGAGDSWWKGRRLSAPPGGLRSRPRGPGRARRREGNSEGSR